MTDEKTLSGKKRRQDNMSKQERFWSMNARSIEEDQEIQVDSDSDNGDDSDDDLPGGNHEKGSGLPVSVVTSAMTATASSTGHKRQKTRKTHQPEILPSHTPMDSSKVVITLANYLIKRRKWPYRGWHKRFFRLENGVLTYGKSEQDLNRGRYNGRCNLGSCFVTFIRSLQRINIDDNNSVYHIKIKEKKLFEMWLEQIALHRQYHQKFVRAAAIENNPRENVYERIDSTNADKYVTSMMDELGGKRRRTIDRCSETMSGDRPFAEELENVQDQLSRLTTILERIKQNPSTSSVSSNVSTRSESSKAPGGHTPSASISSNNSFYVGDYQRQDFVDIAKKTLEKMGILHQRLSTALAENEEQRCTLHNNSREESEALYYSLSSNDTMSRQGSIFYDATDNLSMLNGGEENDESESDASSCYEDDQQRNENIRQAPVPPQLKPPRIKWRRGSLPIAAPDTSGVGLWNIMRKSIGKDLSRVAMPVILNEPLGLLQKLCEEMEYSDLLDRAAQTDDPYFRLVYVTAFIISTYSSNYYRTGRKNFNPLLGETYECIREDKQWKFVAEQVSHHPPISVCSCESPNFLFTQKLQAKIKFWGRSMEIFPDALNVLFFPKYHETITWNKCTMCIHNVLSSDRWIDHYGDVLVESSLGSKARISFLQSDYRTRLNNVAGYICDQTDRVVHKIFGHWHEDVFCGNDQSARCIWRQSALPENSKRYYGFTRFAIELNELDGDLRQQLPPTDTRFRPDQRLLEAGKIDEAEREKARIEQAQRTRSTMPYSPYWFKQDGNRYTLIGNENTARSYWKKREEHWKGIEFIELW